ncbi:MAG: T9SS type A sorting domain-containing protein [Cytophagaceae bacterium]|jgi:hypothetical protein|nr:T9SS type A sorting domain-containing protein [Cytophagaceae bacterium]
MTFAVILEQTGFESQADESIYNRTSLTTDGFNVPWVNGFNDNRCYTDDAFAASGSKSLRVTFPVGQFGPSNSGAQAPLLVTGQLELYSSYYVRFSDNFSWGNTSEGGKLPGLSGGGRCSGCATCNGTNGFSARLMWRNGGRAVLYLYHMDKGGSCGDNINLKNPDNTDFFFQKGVWYKISQRVKVNTGNNYNGEVQLWVNNQPALLVTGYRFVNNGDLVDNLYFSTFHGGSTSGWSPTVTCYAWFDNVVISNALSDVVDNPMSLLPSTPSLPTYLQQAVQVYPSVTTSGSKVTIQIDKDKLSPLLSYRLHSITGKEYIRQENVQATEIQAPIPNDLPAGVYLMSLFFEEGMISKKIIIE